MILCRYKTCIFLNKPDKKEGVLMFFRLCLFIDIMSLLLLYFCFLYPRRRRNKFELFTKTVLYIYLVFVAYFTLNIPIFVPIPFINVNYTHLNINVVPFLDIFQGFEGSIKEIILNSIMFIPFGILYPFTLNKNFNKTLFASIF